MPWRVRLVCFWVPGLLLFFGVCVFWLMVFLFGFGWGFALKPPPRTNGSRSLYSIASFEALSGPEEVTREGIALLASTARSQLAHLE